MGGIMKTARAVTLMRPGTLLVSLLAALALAACGEPVVSGQLTGSDIPAAGVVELSDAFTGAYDLVDTHGDAVGDDDFRGRVQVIYFGFASCPDVCPLALGRLTAALNQLSAREKEALAALFITVDPARDTPDYLEGYLESFPGVTGLTGDAAAIEAAKQSFKVYAAKAPLSDDADDYTVDHTSFFYLVDRAGAPRYALYDTLTPEELAVILREAIAW